MYKFVFTFKLLDFKKLHKIICIAQLLLEIEIRCIVIFLLKLMEISFSLNIMGFRKELVINKG